MANLVCEQLAFRLFEKFVQAAQQRQRDRKHPGAERDRADPGAALALHLRVSQPGAFAQMAAGDFPQMTGAIPPPLQNRKRAWFTDTLEDVNGVCDHHPQNDRGGRGGR